MNQLLFEQIVQWIGSISIIVAAIMSIYCNNKSNFKPNSTFLYTMIGFACIFGLTLIYRLVAHFYDASFPSYMWSLWLAELVLLFLVIRQHFINLKK